MSAVSASIFQELDFFLTSLLLGACLVLLYDGIKLFRCIIPHGVILTGAEDVMFWAVCAIAIFSMIFQKNDGLIRGFSIMGIVLGMALYHVTIGRIFKIILKKVEEKIKKLLKKR